MHGKFVCSVLALQDCVCVCVCGGGGVPFQYTYVLSTRVIPLPVYLLSTEVNNPAAAKFFKLKFLQAAAAALGKSLLYLRGLPRYV